MFATAKVCFQISYRTTDFPNVPCFWDDYKILAVESIPFQREVVFNNQYSSFVFFMVDRMNFLPPTCSSLLLGVDTSSTALASAFAASSLFTASRRYANWEGRNEAECC
eukprot:2794969-Amphidinium_carterae.1